MSDPVDWAVYFVTYEGIAQCIDAAVCANLRWGVREAEMPETDSLIQAQVHENTQNWR